MTDGGVVFTFVTVTVPLAFVTTRSGTVTRPRPVTVVVVVADAVVLVAGVVVVARLNRRLPAGFAARVGLGVTPDVSVGDRVALFVAAAVPVVTVDVPVGPAANGPGVAVIAAVVGVASALLFVVAAAVTELVVLPVTAVPVVAPTVDAAVVPAVAPVVAAAVVPVVAPVVAEPMTIAPSPPAPPLVTTGVGSELIEAFTVVTGLA